MNSSESKRVVIVGAGIVGVSTALWLQRHGIEAVLIDQNEPGEGTSFGNAGVLASSSVTPVTAPRMIRKLPGYMLNPNFPLFVVWRKFATVAPFLIRYMLHANDADTRRIAQGIAQIVIDAVSQHKDLSTGTQAEKWVEESPYVYAYRSREHFNQDSYVWSLRREADIVPQEVEGEAVQDLIPGVSRDIRFLAVLNEHGFVLNPGQYVKDLAVTFTENGGVFIKSSVTDLDFENGHVRAIDTACGRIHCSHAVITAGVWSKALATKLRVSVPMESERGYHIVFESPSHKPSCPIMVATGKFVMTPMSMGLRCAGILEFGGLTAPPSKRPLELIYKQIQSVFPGFAWQGTTEWLGHRPAPCDSLPFIGEVADSGMYMGFGHHHIGLTAGPKTGRILAGLIAGQPLAVDLTPYEPMRFTK